MFSYLRAPFNSRDPFFPIQQLSLCSHPEWLDHGIVMAVSNSSEAESDGDGDS